MVLDSLGQMCLAVNGAASNKVIALALLLDVLLNDPDADLLNGIDGMIVQARLRRVACNQTICTGSKRVSSGASKSCAGQGDAKP